MDKKSLGELISKSKILIILSIFTFIVFIFFVLAAGTANIYKPINYGNYSATMNISLNTSVNSTVGSWNASVYYNASGGAVDISSSLLVIIRNGSNGNILENSSVNLSSLADGKIYNISARIDNNTEQVWTVAISNVTIDDTAPNVTNFTNIFSSGNYSGTIVLNVSVIDAVMGAGSVYFNITNSSGVQHNFTKAFSPGSNRYNISVNTVGFIDGKYNVTVYANDTQLGNLNKTEYIQITIDNNGAPAVTSFSNTENSGNYSGTIVLNVSVYDAGVGVDSVYFNITNSTGGFQHNFTKAFSPGSSRYNISVNTAGFIDGMYNITVYANDTANTQNKTGYIQITIDNTAPIVTLSSSSSSTTSVTGSISITENLTGMNRTCSANRAGASISGTGVSQTLTESSINCGTSSSYVITCIDLAGNSGSSSSTSLSTNSCGGGTTTTGGGGSPKITSWTKITPGVATIMKNFNKNTGVKEISIEVNNQAQNVKITVTKYDGKPAEVTKEKTGKVYKYLQISETNLGKNLSKATVKIQVEKSWITNKSLDKTKMALFKFKDGDWQELATTFAEEDATYYYYTTELTSFSYFAIGEKTVILPPAEEGDEMMDTTGGEGDVVPEGAAAKSNTWWWIVIGVLIVAVGAGLAINKVNKKNRHRKFGY